MPNGIWSEPSLTRSSHQGWSAASTTLASGCGKYTQADPLGYFARENTYAYARGNPNHFKDPLGLFSIDRSCIDRDCGRRAEQIRQETIGWCRNIDREINDVALADCIKRKCQTATIRCDDPDGLCGRNYGAYGPYGGNYVNVCTANQPERFPPGTAGAMIIHEFAHNCWWRHGQRRGNSPCNDGSYDCIPNDFTSNNPQGWDY